MGDEFVIEPGKHGPKLVMQGVWSARIAAILQRHGIRDLEINYARGFMDDRLDFLRKIPFLESLSLITYNISDISPIHSLTKLKAVDIGSRNDRTPIDFTCFPHLEDCGFEWRRGSASLFECTALRRLWLNKYTQKDTAAFATLTNLEELYLASSPIDCLSGISELHDLRTLGLYYLRCLRSLRGIENLEYLTELEVRGCKSITSITQLHHLTRLRNLTLADGGIIETIQPLIGLKNLRSFTFYGSTNIADGNLEPLVSLPRLHEVTFRNRRHYTHKREMFAANSQ